jgi:hypothetical protein
MAAEPASAEFRRGKAVAGRKVAHWAWFDGTGVIQAELAAGDALAIWRLVDQVAHATAYDCTQHPENQTEGALDARSMNARRADAFRDLLLGRTTATGGTGVPEVQVVVSAETLAGVSQEPGTLVGHGPITPAHARQLAEGDCRWRRLLFDPATGTLQDLSQHTYRPSTPLSRAVKARDRTCRFPGCNRATTTTGVDLDHTLPWPAGPTTADNLAALCRHHHRLKQHPHWHVTHLPGNILQWTTPTGRIFHTHPHNHRPDEPRSGAPPSKAA